jgi:hypothetical protein
MLLIQKEKSSIAGQLLRFVGTDGILSAIGGYQERPQRSTMAARKWSHALPAIRRKGTRHDSNHSQHRGACMSTAQISLPKGIGPHAEKLFDAITGASTAEELNRAGGKAEGFVLGLESSKAIKSQVAESLYVIYDDAATQRSAELA